jgi:hypothetical protein
MKLDGCILDGRALLYAAIQSLLRSRKASLLGLFLLLASMGESNACELCAIYSAGNALGQSDSGFLFSLSEQFIPYRAEQLDGHPISTEMPSYVDSSITHFVPAYNFSERFGINLNVPLTYLNFRRTDLRYSTTEPPVLYTEKGSITGIGDIALIGRCAVFQKNTMLYALNINLLGGVKFPTGDANRIKDEVQQSELFQSFLPPGTPHDPLGHSITSVHQHELALGSGSYDGVFGLTASGRWKGWFMNGQFQYYLRTSGESDFKYGDELIVSGGPGAFIISGRNCTLSLQANAVYDTMARDELLGQPSNRTGFTAWYLGPLIVFTWGDRFSANAGADLPLRISNNGFQSVPDYRLHGGLSWRF